MDRLGTKCELYGTQPCCSLCGCSLKLKTRSLSSSCPANKWKAVISEEEAYRLEILKSTKND